MTPPTVLARAPVPSLGVVLVGCPDCRAVLGVDGAAGLPAALEARRRGCPAGDDVCPGCGCEAELYPPRRRVALRWLPGRAAVRHPAGQSTHDTLDAAAAPDDWALCQGHPTCATAGFVGCSDHWPPHDHSAEPAEASAAADLWGRELPVSTRRPQPEDRP